MCREDRAWDCVLALAAMGIQREVGTSGRGSLSVSLQGQWFLAQDVVAGKPDCSGMLRLCVLRLCSPSKPGRELSVLTRQTGSTPRPRTLPRLQPCSLAPL